MAWTFLPRSARFFRFKNWCKITFQKKSSLTSALSCAEQVVKLPFFSKKCIFRAEKGIFSKSSFYTKMFSDPKYSFSVCQKYFFAVSKKGNIFHHSQPKYTTCRRGEAGPGADQAEGGQAEDHLGVAGARARRLPHRGRAHRRVREQHRRAAGAGAQQAGGHARRGQ